MKEKNRMLVVPGSFLPYNDTVTLLCYKHLRNLNMQFDVVALSNSDDRQLEKELEQDINFNKFNVEYVADYGKTVASMGNKNVFLGFFNIIKYIRRCVVKQKNNNYSFVYTSSIPCFTHLAGWIIKKRNPSIKWIASFSDPIYKSPYKYDIETFKGYSVIEKIGYFVYIWIYMNGFYEKIAMKFADKIVFICEEQRDFMIANHPRLKDLINKSIIIPLNYIESWDMYKTLLESKPKERKKKLVFSHFGRVYGLRVIDKFLEAIVELRNEDAKFIDTFIFEQYGELDRRYIKYINDNCLNDCVNVYDKVPYDIVVEKMKESDCLVLFDTIMEGRNQPYLPSKTLDYLLLRKDALVISNRNSPAHRIFSSYGWKCYEYNTEEIKQGIKDIISSKTDYFVDLSYLENEVATKPLQEYVNDCVINK